MTIVNILITLTVLHLTSAFFYTNSKENDLPRIGKRHHIYWFDALGRFRKPLRSGKEANSPLENKELPQSRKRINERDILLFLSGYHNLTGSCKEIYADNPNSVNGTYQIMNRKQEPFTVYCVFYLDYGYTYIASTASVHIDIADLYTSTAHALVRHLNTAGQQKETKLEQISKYSSQYPLSFQYNANVGYATPYNHQQMAPYLYLGFLPVTVAQNRNQQGYRANGVDYLFTNCDSNPNSYMAFYFNPNHSVPLNYASCCDTKLMHDWVTHARDVPKASYLPAEFYFFFELHMGGCGGYAIPPTIIHDVRGAALGLRFDYDSPCAPSPCQNGGSCYPDGSRFVCECSEGYNGAQCQNIA
ncbi:uncharacterized protein LOC132558754 [Ylistrum balloti]|uniref:uncharacterized protein LOC132558754 n=1 Tax=Ylistrum balloti TaxID=509963 RepID=UPI002905CA43|nr:uncharacterized protein LOC132558754 [Ylistrum balloti]